MVDITSLLETLVANQFKDIMEDIKQRIWKSLIPAFGYNLIVTLQHCFHPWLFGLNYLANLIYTYLFLAVIITLISQFATFVFPRLKRILF